MESQPQNPEFRINPENFHPCVKPNGLSEQISAQNMLKLYQSIVLPHMEYGSTVWQIGNCEQLDKIQRKCLALCLGTPATAGIEALEVEAGIMT